MRQERLLSIFYFARGTSAETGSGTFYDGRARTVRQVLLNCVTPTQESILGDLNCKDDNTAISLARDRTEWKNVKALESLLAPLGE